MRPKLDEDAVRNSSPGLFAGQIGQSGNQSLVVRRKFILIFLAFALIGFVNLFPYISNELVLIAQDSTDEGLFATKSFNSNAPAFEKDALLSTMLNYGKFRSIVYSIALYLDQNSFVPLMATHRACVAWMMLGLPILYVLLLRKRHSASVLLILFSSALVSQLVTRNLANFYFYATAYPGTMVLPFIWLSLLLLNGGNRLGFFFLAVSSAIHPVLAAYAVFMAGTLVFRKWGFRSGVGNLIWLGLCSGIIVLFSLLSQSTNDSLVADSDWYRALTLNHHATPWSTGRSFIVSWVSFFAFGLLFLAARLEKVDAYGRPTRDLYFSVIFCSVTLCVVSALGHVLKNPFLLSLYGFRSTIILSVFFYPVVFLYLFRMVEGGDLLTRFLSAFVFFGTIFDAGVGQQVGSILCFCIARFLDVKRPIWVSPVLRQVLFGLVFVCCLLWSVTAIGLILPMPKWLDWGGRFELHTGERMLIFGSSVLLSVGAIRWKIRWKAHRVRLLLPIFVGLVVTAVCWFSIKTHVILNSPTYQDIYEIQHWAAHHTPPGSVFITPHHYWVNLSDRPAVRATLFFRYHYSRDRRLKEYEDKILGLYGIDDRVLNGISQGDLMRLLSHKYAGLDTLAVAKLALLTAGDYFVQSTENRKLDFPVAFENGSYRIYDLAGFREASIDFLRRPSNENRRIFGHRPSPPTRATPGRQVQLSERSV